MVDKYKSYKYVQVLTVYFTVVFGLIKCIVIVKNEIK